MWVAITNKPFLNWMEGNIDALFVALLFGGRVPGTWGMRIVPWPLMLPGYLK